jgi:hypothetical protein
VSVPRPARAIDIVSYVSSTAGGGVAIAGAVMMGQENTKHSGKIMLIVGLAVSAGCSVTGLVYDLIVLSAFGFLDRVEGLDAEVNAGGGPMIDAYSVGLGIPREEVLAAVRASLDAVPVHSEADAAAFTADLRGRLLPQARVSEEMSGRIVVALHQENAALGSGPTPWHDTLSNLAGVPVSQLAPSIAAPIDARLGAAEVPGKVVSARAALTTNASATLDAVIDRILADHGAAVDAHVLELSQLASAR